MFVFQVGRGNAKLCCDTAVSLLNLNEICIDLDRMAFQEAEAQHSLGPAFIGSEGVLCIPPPEMAQSRSNHFLAYIHLHDLNALHDEICIVFIPFVYKLPRNALTSSSRRPPSWSKSDSSSSGAEF